MNSLYTLINYITEELEAQLKEQSQGQHQGIFTGGVNPDCCICKGTDFRKNDGDGRLPPSKTYKF